MPRDVTTRRAMVGGVLPAACSAVLFLAGLMALLTPVSADLPVHCLNTQVDSPFGCCKALFGTGNDVMGAAGGWVMGV